jgi:hypothetical protein
MKSNGCLPGLEFCEDAIYFRGRGVELEYSVNSTRRLRRTPSIHACSKDTP